jgi:tetratricopeptide (TPR) repeat protein
VLAGALLAALWGPSPVTRASGRCLDVVRVLRITQGAPAVEAVALRCQAVLEALRGRTEAAQRMIASSRRMVEELGITQQLLETDVYAGLIDLLEGDSTAAERSLRNAYDGLRTQGLGIDAARAAAWLGQALLAQGRAAEAEALSHESETLAGDDLGAAITWRGVRAEALARRGMFAEAIDFARAAVDIAAATDSLLLNANARLALAAALRAAGRRDEADAEEKRTIELWEAKGATVLNERVYRDVGRSSRSPNDRSEAMSRVRRRVRPNAATANQARLDAAVVARDADALSILFADELECVDHTTGVVYDREGVLFSWRSLLSAQDPACRHEPLATLGDSLALYRSSTSASRFAGGKFDVGAYEKDEIHLIEIDAQGRRPRGEIFATDRLGDAVVRLYERYAELLPDGPDRDRATATARSCAMIVGTDPDRWATAMTRGIEFVDHRTVGLGSVYGTEALRKALRVLFDLTGNLTNSLHDVLALRSDAFLVWWTSSGTDRTSGGAFERSFLILCVYGADGLATRIEQFDVGREAEALARFDELAGEPKRRRPARRVRPNEVTASAARLEQAITARNHDALSDPWAEEFEAVDHTTGAVFGRKGVTSTWRGLLAAQDPFCRYEPLATLGASLAVLRFSRSGGEITFGNFDVGAFEVTEIHLLEGDAHGRLRHAEIFAADRLADAIGRLYARYADLLSDGPTGSRAAATARSVAAMLEPTDVDRYSAALAPAAEYVDHRTLGYGCVRGAERIQQVICAKLEVEENLTTRIDDVFGLRSDALLIHRTNFGTDRTGGGAYERPFLQLLVFGADGLVSRWEMFDADRDVEALARLDELALRTVERPTAETSRVAIRAAGGLDRRVRANAATAGDARMEAAIAARDMDAVPALLAEEFEVVDHTTGVTFDGQGYLATLRALLKAEHPVFARETLATLGESLALDRETTAARGFVGRSFDVGAYEKVEIALTEVDAQGRRRRRELFAVDRLGDAIARLYERYAELLPDGAERDRAAATARSVAVFLGPFDPKRYATAFAPSVEAVDHQTVGTWFARGAEAQLRQIGSLLEVADDIATRFGDVLALRSDALLTPMTTSGMDRGSGGAFERPYITLWVFGADGLVSRCEYFDSECGAAALARFDELGSDGARPEHARNAVEEPGRGFEGSSTGPGTRAHIENAATRASRRTFEAWQARDWERLAALFPVGFRHIDRRPLIRLELDRDEWLASYRQMVEMTSGFASEVLATRGERLGMMRVRWEGADHSTGPSEIESLAVVEVDGQGDALVVVEFDPDDLDAAYAELDERYAAGEAAPYARSLERHQRVGRAAAAREWEDLAGLFAPDFVLEDHRALGWGTLRSRDDYVASVRALIDLRPDAKLRMDHILAFDDRRSLTVSGWVGGEPEGAFEMPAVAVSAFGPDEIRRVDLYNLEQLDEARAQFEELRAESAA